MKDEKGRSVIRLGDKTSHGGEVLLGATDFFAMGVAVALEGDLASCPKCGGTQQSALPEASENTMARRFPNTLILSRAALS